MLKKILQKPSCQMLTQQRACFQSRVVKYSGKNVNVTAHNRELREDVAKLESHTFFSSMNMGFEGFSKPWKAPKMHPVVGNRGEFFYLALLFPALWFLKASRKKNEEGMRAAAGPATNRYAHLHNTRPSEF